MPLLGKIVVIKRNGEDGTEFPLTASCLFGRKLNCDIRIQLPQVSKEHCRIELNENKELILTNLSSVNPTLINGEALEQSELLKNGDLITIIDRSFRFEYPPLKTPKKKRLSTTGKDKTPQQEKSTPVPVEKRKSEHSFDTCLKDGSNLPQLVEQTVETADDEKPKKNSMSPFGELCQMVKQDLAAKSPWKSGITKTPLARPQVNCEELEVPTDAKSSSEQVTTPSAKRRRSSKGSFQDKAGVAVPQSSLDASLVEKAAEDMPSVESSTLPLLEKTETPVSQKKRTPSKTPEKFSAGEVVQQILLEPQPEEKTSKSPKGRRSSSSQNQSIDFQMSSNQPQTPAPEEKNTDVKASPRTSPRSNAGKRFQVQDVLRDMKSVTFASEDKDTTSVTEECEGNESHTSVTILKSKRKRVSFGGQLSPELFDKRLPPDSPLRRGATPRRSLGPSQKPQSLLRRASTIGLMALRRQEMVPETSKPQRSPAKKASPKRAAAATKSPSPAKRSPGTKAKTPSPKPGKSPSGTAKASSSSSSTPATPKTPASSRRASTIGNGSVLETPTVQGRFSVSRISTPSPVQDQVDEGKGEQAAVEDVAQVTGTPKIPLRRKSLKSARKTPKSAMKSALEVIRSRRSGASRANLKVLNSWADIVKFGQTKPPTEVTTTRKTTKSSVAKKTTVLSKPKTPARRLKDVVSTGHAASPVTIVVGKAHLRTNQPVGAAPKIVPNLALFKKDMKMDEDLTGVADIFKTPAKPMVPMNNACPETPVDEFSVMKTPEESGEMMVSPLSVISTAKHERYDNEAVTRLLLDNQGGSLLGEDSLSQTADSSHDTQEPVEMLPSEEEQVVPETVVKTPKQAAPPSLCLTGVKRLMKTPKQKAEPIEDLRGKLLKTPKAPKRAQEESLEGVKEVFKTPKHRGVAVEDMVGVKRVMQTPKEKSNPVLCAAGLKRLLKTPQEKSEQHEDLTGVKELMQTPKLMRELVEDELEMKRSVKEKRNLDEEDLTSIEQLMETPKHEEQPVEDEIVVKSLMQTSKEKVELVEDFTGVKELMKTPKHKGEPVKNKFGISKLMKTPRQKGTPTDEDFAGLKELVEEPEISSALTTQNNVTEPVEAQEPVTAVEDGSTLILAEDFHMECDKENVCPVELMETEVLKSVDPQCTASEVDPQLKIEAVIPQKDQFDQIEEEPVSVQVTDVCSSEVDGNNKEQSVCISDNSSVTTETAPSTSTAEQEEVIKSSVASKTQRGSRGRAAQKSKAPAVLSLIDESAAPPSSPGRGRRVKKLIEVPEIAASPVRKSARGKVPKRCFEDEEAKNTQAFQAPVDSMKNEVSDSLPAASKTRRGRKGQKDDAEIEPAVDAQCSDAQASEEELIQAPIPKAGRRRMNNKIESQPSEEKQQTTEIVPAVDAQCLDTQASEEEPIQAPVPKAGRRRMNNKIESQPSEEQQQTNEIVPAVDAQASEEEPIQAPVPKAGRRRMNNKIESQLSEEQHQATEIVPAVDAPCLDTQASEEELIQAPIPKAGRRRMNNKIESQPSEEKQQTTEIVPAVDAQCLDTQASEEEPIQAPVPKAGRRRMNKKIESQPSEEQQQTNEIVPAVDAQCSDAQASEEEPIQAPVPKAGRRRMNNKIESQPSEEQQQTTEIVCEENPVAPDDVSLQMSVGPEAPIAATRTRKGRTTKKESLKNPAPTPVLESDMKSTDVVVAEKQHASGAKSGRGRLSKKETVKDKALDEDPQVEVKVDSQDPEPPVVKSGRGRRAKQQKLQMTEDDDNQAPVESSTHVVVAEEPVTEVKSVRRGRQAKQIVSIKAEENVVSEVEQAEVPVVKSLRKRGAAAKEVEMVADVPVKRGRRAVVDPIPPVAVVSGRGRKAVIKAEPEVTKDTASSEEQVKSIKQTKRTGKVTESTKNENLTRVSSECVAVENTAPEKVGRGSRGKKENGSTKNTSKGLTNESATAVEDGVVKPSKTVNWNPNLVSEDIEEVEPSTDVKEAQLKKSKKLSAKISTETDKSVDLPPRGRRVRGAKKEEEPSVEDGPEEVQIKAKPLRRGKAVASTVPKSEPNDDKASNPFKRKRNEALEVTEDPGDKEPLPKRRGRVANTTEVSSKEKTLEAEPTPKKTSKRTARGQSKVAQEPDPEPAQAPESISGPSTRKGRSVKTTEDVDSTVAAPVRRTRRK